MKQANKIQKFLKEILDATRFSSVKFLICSLYLSHHHHHLLRQLLAQLNKYVILIDLVPLAIISTK